MDIFIIGYSNERKAMYAIVVYWWVSDILKQRIYTYKENCVNN